MYNLIIFLFISIKVETTFFFNLERGRVYKKALKDCQFLEKYSNKMVICTLGAYYSYLNVSVPSYGSFDLSPRWNNNVGLFHRFYGTRILELLEASPFF